MDHTDHVCGKCMEDGRVAGRQQAEQLLNDMADFAGSVIGDPKLPDIEQRIMRGVRWGLLTGISYLRANAKVVPPTDREKIVAEIRAAAQKRNDG